MAAVVSILAAQVSIRRIRRVELLNFGTCINLPAFYRRHFM